jgi:ZIP family zinc transporter
MNSHNLLIAFVLTLIAGLSTGFGGSLAFFTKHTNRSFLSFSLGLAAGVLLFVSFVDIFPESQHLFASVYSTSTAFLCTVASFFGGFILMALIDLFSPHHFEQETDKSVDLVSVQLNKRLKKTGLLVAVAVTLHNIPEGIAMFTIGLSDYRLAFPILLAIIIHNIPIGISISAPIYQATGKRGKALGLALLSGLATPLGALLAWVFLLPYWTPTLEGIVLGAVSATMAYIALDELIPTAEQYGKRHLSKIGLIVGMALVATAIAVMGV